MVYTRNPTEINAIQWKVTNLAEVKSFYKDVSTIYVSDESGSYTGLILKLPDGGNQIAKPFDYIREHGSGKNKFYTVIEKEQFEKEYSSIFQMTKMFILAEQRNVLAKIQKLNEFITDPDLESPYNQMPDIEKSILKSEKYALQAYLQELYSHQLLNFPDTEEDIEADKSKVAVKLIPEEDTYYNIKMIPSDGTSFGKVIVKTNGEEILSVSSEKTTFANLLYTIGTLFGWDETWYNNYVSDTWKELETDSSYEETKEFNYYYLTKTIYNVQVMTTAAGIGKIRILDNDSEEVIVKELNSTSTFKTLADMVANELDWELSWSDIIPTAWLNKPVNTAENLITSIRYLR